MFVSLYLFRSVLDWCWINRSIFDRLNLFFDRLNIVQRFFLKNDFHVFKLTFSKVFQLFSLSIRLGQGSNPIFCHFPPFFLQGFSLPRSVRPLYPSFCIYFHFSCIKSCIIWEISNLRNFGGFYLFIYELSLFFHN